MAKQSVKYDIRPMTRSIKSNMVREFERDFPELSLVVWNESDTDSIKRCFEGCYGAFINTGMFTSKKASMQDLTRGEIELGDRCIEAAKVSSN